MQKRLKLQRMWTSIWTCRDKSAFLCIRFSAGWRSQVPESPSLSQWRLRASKRQRQWGQLVRWRNLQNYITLVRDIQSHEPGIRRKWANWDTENREDCQHQPSAEHLGRKGKIRQQVLFFPSFRLLRIHELHSQRSINALRTLNTSPKSKIIEDGADNPASFLTALCQISVWSLDGTFSLL